MGASQRSGIRRVVVDLPPCVAQSITDDAKQASLGCLTFGAGSWTANLRRSDFRDPAVLEPPMNVLGCLVQWVARL